MLSLTKSPEHQGLLINTAEDKHLFFFEKVEEALDLIEKHDPLRYKRVTSDLDRIWIEIIPGGARANYLHDIKTCLIDPRFLQRETTTTELIASSIVHEATHARLMKRGIGYEEDIRTRVEAVCIYQELAFSKRLPNGEQICAKAEHSLN